MSLKETMLPSWQKQQILSLSDLLHPTSERGLGPRLELWIWASAFSSISVLGGGGLWIWVSAFFSLSLCVLFRLWTLVLTLCSSLSLLVWCFLMKAK